MREQILINIPMNSNALFSLHESTLPSENNMSKASNIIETDSSLGYSGFQLSTAHDKINTPLNGEYLLYDEDVGYPGFISHDASNSDGSFTTDMSFVFGVSNELSDYITVVFDDVSNDYATDFTLLFTTNYATYNVDIENNSTPIVIIPIRSMQFRDETLYTITLRVRKWNRPYKNVKVTQITSRQLLLRFNGNDIYNFTCSENSRDAQLSLSSGIIEQYADIELYDRQGVLRQIISDGNLDNVALCKVTINAIDQNKTYFLGSYRIKNWEARATDLKVNISCNDVFATFTNIEVPSIPIQRTRTLHDWLNLLFSYAGGYAWIYKNANVRDICIGTKLTNSWAKPSDLYTLANKLCAIGFLRIYFFEEQFIVTSLVHLSGENL